MILKRPYAFLIKYFKLINIVLSILSMYIIYKTYNIISFFNNYIVHNYSGNYYSGFADEYISPYLFFIIIVIIIGISAIFLLFVYKKKPIKAYLMSIINYIILIVFFSITKNIMITLETEVITAEVSRIFRDVSLLLIIPQIVFFISFLIRGLGLNIKKFNFQEDLKELEISEKDNEEVEVTFKQDATNLKRTIRRFFREFKYYLKENKFMVVIIILILLFISGFVIYNNIPEIINENYSQGEMFNINGIQYSIDDSIITNLDYSGNIISKNKYYLAVKLHIENLTNDDIDIDYNNFRLEIEGEYIYPSIDKGILFIDYAENIKSNKIKAQTKQTISLVFEINSKDIKDNKKYRIKIANGSSLKDKLQVGKFNYVDITPVVINKIVNENNYLIGEEISFENSNLGESILKISNPIIDNKHIYDYKVCENDVCNTYKGIINLDYTKKDRTLLVLEYEYLLSEKVPFYKTSSNINTLIETFGKIKYVENDEIMYNKIDAVTPKNLNNKIVLEVTNKIVKAEEIYLTIVIRNKEYNIKIK